MIVVDASVLIDALLDDAEAGDRAREVLEADPAWAAPPHLLVEVVAVTRRRLFHGGVRVARAGAAIEASR